MVNFRFADNPEIDRIDDFLVPNQSFNSRRPLNSRSAKLISEVDANLEMQYTEPMLVTCDRLEEVHQHVLGNVLTEHKSLHH